MVGILLSWLVTSVSLFILSKLPLGIEIDSFGKAVVSAAVFGILNALLWPLSALVSLPLIKILTLGILALIVNTIIFGLAALLVSGFRLRWGIWSALLGAIALSIVNSVLYSLLNRVL
ncbi:phage holin family protein [Leptolyngbya sp. FACHB-261]|uniref:phage holin family protein n=1 Tax=Leptolyngbya sp. FACHB-261 TaxID=2692806 RepID=UPI0016842338|nr:phage holin family protein [Leptolyngbya sp. FACHB-261]MBD2100431.1 phage holin family protein [Leptolyngbya sp. FACHB-261]